MIFADDDIELTSKAKNVTNPIDEWYSFLRETQPAVGIGRFRQVGWERDRLVSVCNFDAVLNAFHRDVVPVLLPYTERSVSIIVFYVLQSFYNVLLCLFYFIFHLAVGWCFVVDESTDIGEESVCHLQWSYIKIANFKSI